MSLHLCLSRSFAVLAFVCTTSAFAADKPKAVALAAPKAAPAPTAKMKPYRIVYGSAPWNLDSTKFDQAYMFVREKNSGKIAKLLLEETATDSSIFSGTFSLDWKSDSPAAMEAYVFAESVHYGPKELAKVTATIQSGKAKPSPLVSREENGIKVIDVYDTKEQAKRAREAYDNQLNQKKMTEMAKKLKKPSSGTGIEVKLQAEKTAILDKLANESANRETMRIRMEQLEAQRLAKIAADNAALSVLEREKQVKTAAEWVQKGDAAYDKSDYVTSEQAYSKAVELNPNDKSPYFKYGVSQFRNEKMNDALVALKLSTTTSLEKPYYMGLIHYRLKELAKSTEYFTAVQKSGDKTLAASAAFYIGVIKFAEEDFDQAKESFEWVLDNSVNDPALDKKAEDYIERIAGAIEMKKEASRKWSIHASGGLDYDSNILYATDGETTQGSTFNANGLRYMLSGDAEYRYSYHLESEAAARVSTAYIYSADPDYAIADPFVISAALPYTRKGIWNGKSYKAIFTPGYEKIDMDVDNTGVKTILKTMMLSADVTLVERPDYFAGYSVEVRQEDSLLTSSTGDDDLDATKASLKTQHTFLLGDAKKTALVAIGGFTWNKAKGANKDFQRFDIGAIYVAPWKKFTNTTWNTGLTAYKLDYINAETGRSDTDISFLLGMSKVLNESWGYSVNASYTNNASTDSDYQYSKYTAMVLATYAWSK